MVRSMRGDDPQFLRTAWTVQVMRGVLISAVACLIAWPVSVIYEQPVLFPLIAVLSVSIVVRGFASIMVNRLSRELAVKKLTLFEFLAQLISVIFTVLAAWILGSVWALAIGTVIGAVIYVALSHLFLPRFDHRFRLERESYTEIFSYGRWILLATMFTFLGGQGMQAVQGLLVPIEFVGLLAISNNLAQIPRLMLQKLAGGVGFPALSQVIRERPDDLPRSAFRLRLFFLFTGVPFLIVLSLLSQFVIDVLYDDRYGMAGVFLGLMALNVALGIVSSPYQQIMLASGDSRRHAMVMFLSASAQILCAIVGFQAGGIIGMLLGGGVAGIAIFALTFSFAWRRGVATLGLDMTVLLVISLAYAYKLYSI